MSPDVATALPDQAEAAVELRGIEVAFRLADGTDYRAVRDIDLKIAPGEFVAIVGPTASGKTALADILAIGAGVTSPLGVESSFLRRASYPVNYLKSGTLQNKTEDLQWVLLNSVEFLFN